MPSLGEMPRSAGVPASKQSGTCQTRSGSATPPSFDDTFRRGLEQLVLWRRDVRRFRPDALEPALLQRLVGVAACAPSVGNSQPWRFVEVADIARRAAVRRNFLACNDGALAQYEGEQAHRYASLKLAGLDDAPVHLAVFADRATSAGHGLGRQTMPEALDYSVVLAVHTLWLAARSYGIGVGWVSILDPAVVSAALEVAPAWHLIAYLCIGYPAEEHLEPELERQGWQERDDATAVILRR
jgi:5,6-dimethylbenzimidazole synthase